MPYKDPEKRREAVKKSHDKIYLKHFTVYVRRGDESFLNALEKAAGIDGVSLAEFVTTAAKEKLERDNVVAVTASPAELRTGITKSHRSRPRRRIRLGVIPEKPDKP